MPGILEVDVDSVVLSCKPLYSGRCKSSSASSSSKLAFWKSIPIVAIGRDCGCGADGPAMFRGAVTVDVPDVLKSLSSALMRLRMCLYEASVSMSQKTRTNLLCVAVIIVTILLVQFREPPLVLNVMRLPVLRVRLLLTSRRGRQCRRRSTRRVLSRVFIRDDVVLCR